MDKQQNPVITPEMAAKFAKMNKAQVVEYFSKIISTPYKKVFDLVIFKGDNNKDYSLITIDLEQHHIDRAQADLNACKSECKPDEIPSAQLHVSGTSAVEKYKRTDPSTGMKATTHFNTNKNEDRMTVDRISFHSERVAKKPEYKGFRIGLQQDKQPKVEDQAIKTA